jgi:hypothetical protein
MAKVWKAEDFAKAKNVDMEKLEAKRKTKATNARNKRIKEDSEKEGFMKPSGSMSK